MSLFHRNKLNNHFLQTFDDAYGKMCGESNQKNDALETDFSTTALPYSLWFVLYNLCPVVP